MSVTSVPSLSGLPALEALEGSNRGTGQPRLMSYPVRLKRSAEKELERLNEKIHDRRLAERIENRLSIIKI